LIKRLSIVNVNVTAKLNRNLGVTKCKEFNSSNVRFKESARLSFILEGINNVFNYDLSDFMSVGDDSWLIIPNGVGEVPICILTLNELSTIHACPSLMSKVNIKSLSLHINLRLGRIKLCQAMFDVVVKGLVKSAAPLFIKLQFTFFQVLLTFSRRSYSSD
jgi:hypothetical protein